MTLMSWISIWPLVSRVSKLGITIRMAARAAFAESGSAVTHEQRSLFSKPALKYGTSVARRSSADL